MDRPWGEESDGLRARIWVQRPDRGSGKAILLHYEIQNCSPAKRTIWHCGFWPDHQISVTGPDGKPATPTPEGRKLRQAFDPEGPREKMAGHNLAPGEIDSAWEAYDLRGLYNLSVPGTYRVQYVYQEGRMKPVKSNIIAIVVK